jgi:hypothetical protein
VEKEAYAPFEIQNGYASDRFLRNEPSRAGEYKIRQRNEPSRAGEFEIKTRVNTPLISVALMSRSQWRKTQNRRVIARDEQAMRVIVTSTGHHLHLFSIEQTRERLVSSGRDAPSDASFSS